VREKKISTDKKKEYLSKNFILNASILILFLINSILAYSVFNAIPFNDSDYNYLEDVLVRIQVEVLNGCG
jgi:hypothetical protein